MPGMTQTERMPSPPSSRAKLRVSPSIAALAVWYRVSSSSAKCQLIDPMLTITPLPLAFMPGITACAAKNRWRKFTPIRLSQ